MRTPVTSMVCHSVSSRSERRRGGAAAASARPHVRCSVEPLEPRQLMSVYYVSPGGSDRASGKSIHSAWRSVARVNKQVLKAGDVVLFEGRHTYSGGLYVPSKEGGTKKKPVVFASYGRGRATISSGTAAGIDIAQTAGVTIANLNFVGQRKGSTPGIYVHTDRTNNKMSSLVIANVDVSNYGHEGIYIGTWARGSSLSDVTIASADVHDNVKGGLKAVGSAHNSNKHWLVDHVRAWNNTGIRNSSEVTGSGIFIADAQDLTVQRCVAHDNGKYGAAPVGIWTAGSNRVVFQYNESYNNHTKAISDGGGFDFDWDVTNSVMQYNYSHGNDGPGLLIYAGTHSSSGNIIRYNVTENDGRKNGKGGIQLGGNVTNTDIYNNVVYFKNTGNALSAAFIAHDYGSNGLVPKNISVRNNIFQTSGGAKLVSLQGGVAQKTKNFKFTANAYYASGGAFKIQWGSSNYSSLNGWRNGKGQEKSGNVSTGFQGDPRLRAPGHGGTVGNADLLAKKLRPYTLARSSPVINKGVPKLSFLQSVNKPVPDFFGRKGLKGGKYDLGVEEVR